MSDSGVPSDVQGGSGQSESPDDEPVDNPRTRYLVYAGGVVFVAGSAASALTDGHVLSGVVLVVGYLMLSVGVLADAYLIGRSEIGWPGGSRWPYALGTVLVPLVALAYLPRRRQYRANPDRW
jgi:hypothetical protein